MKSRGLVWARSNNYKVRLNCGRRKNKKGRVQVVPWSFSKQFLLTASKMLCRKGEARREWRCRQYRLPKFTKSLPWTKQSNRCLKSKTWTHTWKKGRGSAELWLHHETPDGAHNKGSHLNSKPLPAMCRVQRARSRHHLGITEGLESMSHFLLAAWSDFRWGVS